MQTTDTPEPSALGRDGRRYALADGRWRDDTGQPLMPEPGAGLSRAAIDTTTRSQWRYRAALPERFEHEVTLGEGRTPLLPFTAAGTPIAVKAEWFNPTGSFKDRGMSVLVSSLKQHGVRAFLEDSSGNGGSSAAAYAAAAGLAATILVPRGTSAAKTTQSRLMGATVEEFDGTRSETAAEAVRRSAELPYASHNWHPAFLDGVKLLGYELWEDLGFTAPHTVIVPAGAGSLVLGLSLAFTELLGAGAIDRMPRLIAAQPAHCSPLAAAFDSVADEVDAALAPTWRPTIAEGASIALPVRDREVLAAVRASGGAVVAVDEPEITAALGRLLARGLYPEPTSALAFAAAERLAASGALRPDDGPTVVVLTGSGLKAPTAMSALLEPSGAR